MGDFNDTNSCIEHLLKNKGVDFSIHPPKLWPELLLGYLQHLQVHSPAHLVEDSLFKGAAESAVPFKTLNGATVAFLVLAILMASFPKGYLIEIARIMPRKYYRDMACLVIICSEESPFIEICFGYLLS